MAKAFALTINVHDLDVAPSSTTLPAALEARLNSTPTKSPSELSDEIKARSERSAALRQAHLDSVRDRSARTSQLAREAAARKLRNAAARVEKLQAKMDAATSKTEAKKEANEASREAKAKHREALATAVAEARQAKADARTIRHMQHLQLEKHASVKRAVAMASIKDKGAASVKHAIAVAQAHKEKEVLTAESRGAAIESKLAAAEVRRESLAAPPSPTAATHPPGSEGRLHRVRNDDKVLAETKRKLFASKEAKASERAAAHLAAVANKASAENAKVDAVVSKSKAIERGTDPATVEARHALYERLMRAEVARLTALKAKYSKARRASKEAGTDGAPLDDKEQRLIVVRLDDILSPRAPPSALVKRLTVARTSLLATAAARQAGAASRREMAAQPRRAIIAKGRERRAAAHARVSKAHAALAAKVAAKAAHAALKHAAATEASAAHVASRAAKRRGDATTKRAALAAKCAAAGERATAKCAAASARRAEALGAKGKGKGGGASARLSANQGRRAFVRAKVLARGESLAARCAKAADARAALLAAKVEVARKHIAAPHPKRVVEDMEIH